MQTIIIGGGAAGLACARYLQAQGRPFLLLEASQHLGGRLHTTQVEGFLLDRGFQIFNTNYAEAKALLPYEQLGLRAFQSGAMIRQEQGFAIMGDPLKNWRDAWPTLRAPLGSLADKLRILRLQTDLSQQDFVDYFESPEQSTRSFLEQYGFSEKVIQQFFQPFFGGVFLEENLATSARFFKFIFQQFAQGEATLPQGGIQQLAQVLAEPLPASAIRLETRVLAIEGKEVLLHDGSRLQAEHIVVATQAAQAARLLGQPAMPIHNSTLCNYFAAPSSPLPRPLLVLNPQRHEAISHLAVLSDAQPSYAPQGQALVSVTTQGRASVSPDEVKKELLAWFGPSVETWRHLQSYAIADALPHMPQTQHQPTYRLAEGLYRCGDYLAYPSLNAALQTGREVAELIGALS
jgi:protoporphyrinogen oxidase